MRSARSRRRARSRILRPLCAAIALATVAALHPASNRLMRRLGGPLSGLSERLGRALDGALIAVADLSERRDVVARAIRKLGMFRTEIPVVAS